MNTNLSFLLDRIIPNNLLHAKWLNTLSLMENSGARKIAASESKTHVTLMVLKHAAEEARHAFILKKQIDRIATDICPDYNVEYLLAGWDSRNYLNRLDCLVSRYLKKELGLEGERLRFASYLLVTYAIEVRADALYPVYQEQLEKYKSKVNVKSIILEEEGHLEEMVKQLKDFWGDWEAHARYAIEEETRLFEEWMEALDKELSMQN